MAVGQVPIDLADEFFQGLAGLQHVIWDPNDAFANVIVGGFSAIACSQRLLTGFPGFFCLLACIKSPGMLMHGRMSAKGFCDTVDSLRIKS